MKDTQIQWHPAFVAAMNLEMSDSHNVLKFDKEYNLNMKPLEIDLLITRKTADIPISNEIGKIFKGHNILEYKDPADHLDIDVFYKVEGYACLYKSYGATVDGIKASDITMTLVREAKPVGLFQYFRENNYQVSSPYQGIYYIEGNVLFPTQIIVTGELEPESHIWLKSLSGRLERSDIQRLLKHIGELKGKMKRELADAVLEVAMKANPNVVEEIIGDDNMSEALLEIIKPIIEPKLLEREKAGLKKGIQVTIDVLRELGQNDSEIKMIIQNKYSLSEDEAESYLQGC